MLTWGIRNGGGFSWSHPGFGFDFGITIPKEPQARGMLLRSGGDKVYCVLVWLSWSLSQLCS